MKKIPLILVLGTLLSGASLQAQEVEATAEAPPKIESSSDLQNWIFAGCSVVVAAVGIFLISMDNGQSSANGH